MVNFLDIAAFAETELGANIHMNYPDFELTGVATVSSWGEGRLAFCKTVDAALVARAAEMDRAALIIPRDGAVPGCPCIVTDNPRYAYASIVEKFFVVRPVSGIHITALVDPTAKVDETATVGPYCTIGADVTIGAHTVPHNHVTIARNVVIGENSIIGLGAAVTQSIPADVVVAGVPAKVIRHLKPNAKDE